LTPTALSPAAVDIVKNPIVKETAAFAGAAFAIILAQVKVVPTAVGAARVPPAAGYNAERVAINKAAASAFFAALVVPLNA